MYTLIRVLNTICYLLTCVLVLLTSLTINIRFRIYWQLFIYLFTYLLFLFIMLVVDRLSQSSSACCCLKSPMRNIYSCSFFYLFKAATCTACYDWFKAWVTCGFVLGFFFSFPILYRQRIRCIMNKFSNNPIQLHVLARKSKGNLHNAKWSWIGYLCR